MYIFGRHAVTEALKSRIGASDKVVTGTIEKIFIQYGVEGAAIDEIRKIAREQGIPCAIMDKRKFSQMEREVAPGHTVSQGVVARLIAGTMYSVPDLLDVCYQTLDNPVIVVVDSITDPHNLGAIARSVDCSGAQGLIVGESRSAPLSGTALKSSAGALAYLPVARASSIQKALLDCKQAGFMVIALSADAATVYSTPDLYQEPTVLIIGSEGRGIHQSVMAMADVQVGIPMAGNIPSLNASVASAIVLFEIQRQRSLGKYSTIAQAQ